MNENVSSPGVCPPIPLAERQGIPHVDLPIHCLLRFTSHLSSFLTPPPILGTSFFRGEAGKEGRSRITARLAVHREVIDGGVDGVAASRVGGCAEDHALDAEVAAGVVVYDMLAHLDGW